MGLGYVGLTHSVLLAQNHAVTAVDVSEGPVQMVNASQCPIIDPELERFLGNQRLPLMATTEPAYEEADFVVVATPTGYGSRPNFFNTSGGEALVAEAIKLFPTPTLRCGWR